MQAAEMRMMCEKTLRDEIPNGLLKDRTRVEDLENLLGGTISDGLYSSKECMKQT